MLRSERVDASAAGYSATIVLTSKAGTHTFTARDRLWVSGRSQPAIEVRPGDLVAFLGRILAVQFVANDSTPDAEKTAQQGDPGAQLTSVAA